MRDFPTRAVFEYIKGNGISIEILAKQTSISCNVLNRVLKDGVRSLRADEFLLICATLEKDPLDFKKSTKEIKAVGQKSSLLSERMGNAQKASKALNKENRIRINSIKNKDQRVL